MGCLIAKIKFIFIYIQRSINYNKDYSMVILYTSFANLNTVIYFDVTKELKIIFHQLNLYHVVKNNKKAFEKNILTSYSLRCSMLIKNMYGLTNYLNVIFTDFVISKIKLFIYVTKDYKK